MRGQQRIGALALGRIVVEPEPQQHVGVDADHPRLRCRCRAMPSSICSTVGAVACGDFSRPRMRRASGLTARIFKVPSGCKWTSSRAPACRPRRSRISLGSVIWPLPVSVASRAVLGVSIFAFWMGVRNHRQRGHADARPAPGRGARGRRSAFGS